ncbi:lytic transglycosylase domain-containing protein [Bradyrhizobium sp. BEA-2-5]|uniref:lytic transglycosylase domain-containing protein n=1 Tax=Bradyrhizobium sp. BEA-2-5 TaxID=3080015 RepID=UPI00293F5136|nr:lytic transglycosylase domain-containing protein [Bradyrhizobium sp. BEA-2-5]WOH79851.1 lytic transglycosylase domain-containing protein [Bradyrhizobium sp. BEA-2-5]
MKTVQALGCLAAIALLASCASAQAQSRAQYEAMVAAEAQANGVPEALVHRVIMRESRYQPHLVGRGGTIGLMQIKLATARGVGYTGDAAGLRDPNTNLTYAVKYLAGAYRAANGDHARAVRYFAGGYYYAAKRQRRDHLKEAKHGGAGAPPKEFAKSEHKSEQMTADTAEPKPEQAEK